MRRSIASRPRARPPRRSRRWTAGESLVPVDGSDCGVRAVGFATGITDRYDGEVLVAHIPDATWTVLDGVREAVDDHDRVCFEAVVREMSSPTAGRIGHEIVGHAAEVDADHVVMSHHGAGVVERAILGRAAETVVPQSTSSTEARSSGA